MRSNASASTRTSSRRSPISMRGAEVAAVDARGDVRHAPQRRGDARGDREAARPARAQRRQRAGEQELVAHGPLGAVGRPRSARPRRRARRRARRPGARTRSSTRPTSGRSWTVKPGGAARNARAGAVLARLLRRALALVGGREPEELGLVADRAAADRGHEEHVARRAERLVGEVGAGARGDRRRLRRARATRPARARPCRSAGPGASAPRALARSRRTRRRRRSRRRRPPPRRSAG